MGEGGTRGQRLRVCNERWAALLDRRPPVHGFWRILAVIIVAWIAVVQVREWTMTDEDRLRGLIAEAEAGWNDGSAGRTVEPLADDFVLYPFGGNRDWLQSILFNIYTNNRHPKTHEFAWEVDVDWESVELQIVDPEAETPLAQVSGLLSLTRTDGRTDGNYQGRFGVEALKREGDWRIVRATMQGLGSHRRRPPKDSAEGGARVR